METAVIIIPYLGEKVNVQKVKQYIHEYVGNRMIKEEPESMPGLVLYGVLEEKDKSKIGKQCENCTFIFLEHDEKEDNIPNCNYLTVKL